MKLTCRQSKVLQQWLIARGWPARGLYIEDGFWALELSKEKKKRVNINLKIRKDIL